jgi:hypothetical protein
MAKNKEEKGNQASKSQDITSIVQRINEIGMAIEQYKAENPDIDVEALLSGQKELLPVLRLLPNRELDRFVAHAKEQGTKMPFQAMEMGVLVAGRKDMQSGLAEILNSIKSGKPVCPECSEGMDDRGRSKKKS